jgi:hypothetical protein
MRRIGLLLCVASVTLVIFTLVSLAGCTSNQMLKEYEVKSSYITWERKAPVTCGLTLENTGCAEWSLPRSKDINACKITADFDVPDWVLGHEFRHCFGEVHSVLFVLIK